MRLLRHRHSNPSCDFCVCDWSSEQHSIRKAAARSALFAAAASTEFAASAAWRSTTSVGASAAFSSTAATEPASSASFAVSTAPFAARNAALASAASVSSARVAFAGAASADTSATLASAASVASSAVSSAATAPATFTAAANPSAAVASSAEAAASSRPSSAAFAAAASWTVAAFAAAASSSANAVSSAADTASAIAAAAASAPSRRQPRWLHQLARPKLQPDRHERRRLVHLHARLANRRVVRASPAALCLWTRTRTACLMPESSRRQPTALGYASVIYLAPGTVQARASTGSRVCVDSLDNSRNDIPMYTIVDADMCTPLTGLMIRLMNDHGNSDLAAASAIAAAFNLDGYVDVFTTSIVVEMTATFDPTELAYLLEWLKVQGQVKLTLEAFADAASPEVAAASIGEVTWDCTGVLADLISTSNVFSMTSASSLLK